MDTQLYTALIQSFSAQLEQRLLDDTYRLDTENTCLISNRRKVICIVNEEIGEHKNSPLNLALAKAFYDKLPPQIKSLAQLRVAPHNASKSLVRPANDATLKEKYPTPGPRTASANASSRSENLLTDEHYKRLKSLLENQTDSAYFNDDAAAITSLDGQIHYMPGKNGKFKIDLTCAKLPNYRAIKEHYTEWATATSAAQWDKSALRGKDKTFPKKHTKATPGLLKASLPPTPHTKSPATKPKSSPIKQKPLEPREYQSEKKLTRPTMTAAQPPSGKVQWQIQQFLDNIDAEIDLINIPGPDNASRWDPETKSRIRSALKNTFALYREQFKSGQWCNTTQKLQNDLDKLKEMQRSMYHAARSPDAKPEDLPLKGIKNRDYDCLPISQNQCEIHNQNYLFFVTAYQLIGEDALCPETHPIPNEEIEEKRKIQNSLINLRKERADLESLIRQTAIDNKEKRATIEDLKKEDPEAHKKKIKEKAESIFLNELLLPGHEEDLAKLQDKLHREEERIKDIESKERAKAINLAKDWSSFYKYQLSTKQTDNRTRHLPEKFNNPIDRGNTFPSWLFGIPNELHVNYDIIPKSSMAKVLQQNWTAVCVDQNAKHFCTLVKRTDGSIAELNDSCVNPKRFPNVQAMIAYFMDPDCKFGIRIQKN
ncbi:hypothetical protein [Endozoicomonas sp. ALB115]|uniref:hypothetical protein n=1 Tax=Endozoicomonas sp. ALB115 TaxID=3403074 RepID=UPI003BB530C4